MTRDHRLNNQGANQRKWLSGPSAVLLSGMGFLSGVTLLAGNEGLAQSAAAESSHLQPVPIQPIDAAPTEITPVAPPPPIPAESFPVEFSNPASAPVPQYQPIEPIAAPPVTPAPADAYIAPSTIIFSERSSGCQATVSPGQAPSSLCDGGGGISPGTTPSVSQVSIPGWRSATGQPSSSVAAVGVGSLTVVTPTTKIGTTPSLRDFYQRTLRPPGRLGNGNVRLIFPLAIPAPISSLFGWRIHPITGDSRFHTGTDIAAPLGTPVLAAYAGQVTLADFLGGYGLAVAIDHTKGTQQTLYAHLSEVFVKTGDQVKQGDVIGRVGSTGNSTGAHLHFEFRQLTTEGWVALDAGAQLEYALAQLVSSLEVAQASPAAVKANVGVTGVIQ